MVSRRLLYCLSAMVLVLWSTGATAIWLINAPSEQSKSQVSGNIQTVDAAKALRALTISPLDYESNLHSLIVSCLIFMGTIFAVLLYHELSRLRVEPVTTLETDLIARVSHEIKTPLTGIRLALLLLLEERFGVLDKMQKTLISSASSDCERLLETVNGLLYFTNAEGKTIHLNRIPVDLMAKVEQSACRFHDIAVKKSLVIRIEGNANRFPEVLADRERLDEVLNSLLSNAVSHSPEGAEIILALSKPDAGNIRLSVIDHGLEIPDECKGRIFERFYPAAGQKCQGLDIGLFISRDTMIAHGGRIGLLDRTDGLTEFFIDIPIARSEEVFTSHKDRAETPIEIYTTPHTHS
jgi:signal transduction histidine kinase